MKRAVTMDRRQFNLEFHARDARGRLTEAAWPMNSNRRA
jgi:hypothetical protein